VRSGLRLRWPFGLIISLPSVSVRRQFESRHTNEDVDGQVVDQVLVERRLGLL
jgi:hypothetical protein